jgi:hypothetical protein
LNELDADLLSKNSFVYWKLICSSCDFKLKWNYFFPSPCSLQICSNKLPLVSYSYFCHVSVHNHHCPRTLLFWNTIECFFFIFWQIYLKLFYRVWFDNFVLCLKSFYLLNKYRYSKDHTEEGNRQTNGAHFKFLYEIKLDLIRNYLN